MSKKLFSVCVVLLMSSGFVAQASDLRAKELSGLEITAQQLVNPKGEIILRKKVFDELLVDDLICAGSETQTLPVIGQCPDVPGYVELGFPVCTQIFDIPKKFTFQEIAPGFVKLVCELDYANATPLGSPECDYSACRYIEEPEFP